MASTALLEPALAERQAAQSAPVSPTTEHVFVNNIRYWSMFAVIYIHCAVIVVGSTLALPFGVEMFVQSAKFGTIAFFFISGFLLGERVVTTGRVEYWKRRALRVLPPWLLWIAGYTFLLVGGHAILHRELPNLFETSDVLRGTIFGTAYWFVPNILFAISILLVFANYIESWRLGVVLLAASMFYGVNIYFDWIPTPHPTAFFGFVGYLWLGAWSHRNWKKVTHMLSKTPTWLLSSLAIGAWSLSLAEAHLLRSLKYQDPVNTLRISNQIFSMLVVMLFLKIPHQTWPPFIKVREHTFGLFLIHCVILQLFYRGVLRHFGIEHMTSALNLLLVGVLAFVITYSGSLILTMLLAANPRLDWSVGARAPSYTPTVKRTSPSLARRLTDTGA